MFDGGRLGFGCGFGSNFDIFVRFSCGFIE